MHSHEGEESHVNIPPGVPHAFKNIGNNILPTNIWKYDVLDYFPFDKYTTKSTSRFTRFKNKLLANKTKN